MRQFAIILVIAVMAGCAHMRPGSLAMVTPISNQPRAGNVYLLRGWIGIFSSGIDQLTEKINADGVRAHVFQDDQWKALAVAIKQKYANVRDPEPLVLIGHSYGADDVIRVARELEASRIKVDLLITLDPVTPPAIPGNVAVATNIYQPGALDMLPVLRGVPVHKADGSPAQLANLNMRKERSDLLEPNTNHFNIEKNLKVHGEVLREVRAQCPPRPQWIAMSRPPKANNLDHTLSASAAK